MSVSVTVCGHRARSFGNVSWHLRVVWRTYDDQFVSEPVHSDGLNVCTTCEYLVSCFSEQPARRSPFRSQLDESRLIGHHGRRRFAHWNAFLRLSQMSKYLLWQCFCGIHKMSSELSKKARLTDAACTPRSRDSHDTVFGRDGLLPQCHRSLIRAP